MHDGKRGNTIQGFVLKYRRWEGIYWKELGCYKTTCLGLTYLLLSFEKLIFISSGLTDMSVERMHMFKLRILFLFGTSSTTYAWYQRSNAIVFKIEKFAKEFTFCLHPFWPQHSSLLISFPPVLNPYCVRKWRVSAEYGPGITESHLKHWKLAFLWTRCIPMQKSVLSFP
jgi:hypothetical protein